MKKKHVSEFSQREQHRRFYSILHHAIGVPNAKIPPLPPKTRFRSSVSIFFVNEGLCLDYIFRKRFPRCKKGWYRMRTNPCFVNGKIGRQIYPLVGTAFQKTTTPLGEWFYAIYLFSMNDRISAKELQRRPSKDQLPNCMAYRDSHQEGKK